MKYLKLIPACILFSTGMTFGQMRIVEFDHADTPIISEDFPLLELVTNSYQETNFDFSEVRSLEVEFGGSADISSLAFNAQVPEPSTYGFIGACFLVGLIYFRRRKLS